MMNQFTPKSPIFAVVFKLILFFSFSAGIAIALYIAMQPKAGLLFTNSDFEEGNLKNWAAKGAAFSNQPTYEDNPLFRGLNVGAGIQGKYWVGSYENRPAASSPKGAILGDAPVGKLISEVFIIRQSYITFLTGAGNGSLDTSVALQVDNKIVLNELPNAFLNNQEKMHRVTWNVKPWLGKKARILVADNCAGPWCHINVDDFRYK